MERNLALNFASPEIHFSLDTQHLVHASTKLRLNTLFNSVKSKGPTTVLFWGKKGCGKTSLIGTLINIVHGHSSGSTALDHSVLSSAMPNPMIQYPSTLINLVDASSSIFRDVTTLVKAGEFLETRASRFEVVVFVVNLSEDFSDLIPEMQLYQSWAEQVNRTPILVLTHIESTPEDLLNETVAGLRRVFKHVVPISNYTSTTTQRTPWTESAGTEILCLARK